MTRLYAACLAMLVAGCGSPSHHSSHSSISTDPAGATARCADGMYSHSHSHSGTCSHHGGVDEWYD